MDNNRDSIGERIARHRRRRGLTQEVLAGFAGMSRSWLQKVESGERAMDRISTLLLLAEVLKVEPGELIGGVSLPPNGGAPLDTLRGILAVRGAMFEPVPDREPPDAAELRASVGRAVRLAGDGSYQALASVLPKLIADARAAVVQETPGASWSLAGTYSGAFRLACAVGEQDLALLAADRAIGAAERSGDALAVATAKRQMARVLMRQGWLNEAGTMCSNAADALAPTASASAAVWAVWGSLHLRQAIIAARGRDTAAAWRLLRGARAALEHAQPGQDDYATSFSPANVGAHDVAVALESGDVVEALRLADHVEVEALPTNSRRVRLLVDVAHAHALRRDDGAAVAAVLEAERHGSEVVRYSAQARELVRVCLSRERRSRTPGLRGLAGRVGVTG